MSSIKVGDPLDILEGSNVSEQERKELEGLVDDINEAYDLLQDEEPLKAVEDSIDMFSTYSGAYDGEVGEKVDDIAVLSSAVSMYLSEYESVDKGSVYIEDVLEPLEDYDAEIDYNGHEDGEVEGDPGLFFVTNTIGMNGIEHGKEDQDYQIWAQVQELPDDYRIDIWDNGSGIPENYERGQIFKDEIGDGTGKGLYLATEILDLFDGELTQSEELEKREDGAGFELYLKKA